MGTMDALSWGYSDVSFRLKWAEDLLLLLFLFLVFLLAVV